MLSFLDRVPLTFFIAISASLGMAPFFPVPHVWEKLLMLMDGSLINFMDIFDLFFHGLPWVLLAIKSGRLATRKNEQTIN